MTIIAIPQPQRWHDYWLWLNLLHTSTELHQRFVFRDGVWYEN